MKLSINLSKVQLKQSQNRVTGKIGLGWVVACMKHFGIKNMIVDVFGVKRKSNRVIHPFKKIMVGVMNLLGGGETVEDIEVIRKDSGLLDILGWVAMPCADTLLNFVKDRRNNAKLRQINNAMVVEAMKQSEQQEFTYDNDATYIDSEKNSATYSYQKKKQFSGLIGCLAEINMINTVEYRPGNINPRDGVLNQLRKSVKQAKRAGKKIVKFRSDSAGHQNAIFTYCDMNDIEYYISLAKNKKIKKNISGLKGGDWKTMYGSYKDQEEKKWAVMRYEVSKGFSMRALVLRWKNPDPDLFNVSPYCYHVVGTNNYDVDPMEWLEIHNGRMGTIEHCNKELKSEYGCEWTTSHNFEKNRGCFLLGILAYNMMQIMKLFYLGESALKYRTKKIRHWFINVSGKIVKSGRRFTCKIMTGSDVIFEFFRQAHFQMQTKA